MPSSIACVRTTYVSLSITVAVRSVIVSLRPAARTAPADPLEPGASPYGHKPSRPSERFRTGASPHPRRRPQAIAPCASGRSRLGTGRKGSHSSAWSPLLVDSNGRPTHALLLPGDGWGEPATDGRSANADSTGERGREPPDPPGSHPLLRAGAPRRAKASNQRDPARSRCRSSPSRRLCPVLPR